MKRTVLVVGVMACSAALWAQAPAAPAPGEGKFASTNAPGREYPKGDAERRATFRIHAPDAESVGMPRRSNSPRS